MDALSPTSAKSPITRGELVALFGILTLGFLLRLVSFDRWSLWEDEGTSFIFADAPSKPFPRHFPIYFYLLRAWFSVFGPTVAAGRLLSVLIGTMSLLFQWLLVRRILGVRTANYSAILLSLS